MFHILTYSVLEWDARLDKSMQAAISLAIIVILVFLCKSSKSTTLDCSRTRSCPGNEFHCECQTSLILRWFVRLPDGGIQCMKETKPMTTLLRALTST